MDEAGIEAKGLAPLSGFRQAIAGIGDRRALTKYICGELRTDVDALNSTNFQTDRVLGLWIAQDLIQDAPHFIVWHPGAVTGISALVGSTWRSTPGEYLTFHLIDHSGGVLPNAFVDERC